MGPKFDGSWDCRQPNDAERMAGLFPRGSHLPIASMLEETRRRAAAGKRVPTQIHLVLEIDERTGQVIEVVVPQRYGYLTPTGP